jgi:recombinational DNA repair ATPase RecF
MKFVNVAIGHWRNFRDVELSPAPDSTLVCLTGDNGTGKSNIPELLATAASPLGLSPTVVHRRGDLAQEPHSYSVTLRLGEPPPELFGAERWEYYWTRRVSL